MSAMSGRMHIQWMRDSAMDVSLPGRGSCRIRHIGGPATAPTLLLLHGWTATADLNWAGCYPALRDRFQVVALDLRGHGRGVRGPFSLEACADDAAAVLEVLGTGPVVVVGYSMGGPVAMLLWRRHPELVAGMVLCATGPSFASTPLPGLALGGLCALGRHSAEVLRPAHWALSLATHGARKRASAKLPAALLDALQHHDPAALVEAARSLISFRADAWLGSVDVPCVSVFTTEDQVVPPRRQLRLAAGIPGCNVVPLHDGHAACLHPDVFVPKLMIALQDISARLDVRRGSTDELEQAAA
jgi:pimeloyl-ACP methyl ester carboxylesterase